MARKQKHVHMSKRLNYIANEIERLQKNDDKWSQGCVQGLKYALAQFEFQPTEKLVPPQETYIERVKSLITYRKIKE